MVQVDERLGAQIPKGGGLEVRDSFCPCDSSDSLCFPTPGRCFPPRRPGAVQARVSEPAPAPPECPRQKGGLRALPLPPRPVLSHIHTNTLPSHGGCTASCSLVCPISGPPIWGQAGSHISGPAVPRPLSAAGSWVRSCWGSSGEQNLPSTMTEPGVIWGGAASSLT